MANAICNAREGYAYGVGDQLLAVEECCRCGVLFAMPETLKGTALRKSQKAPGETVSFWCPNGHKQSYVGENKEQKLERQLRWERDYAARLAAERDQAKASAKAQKAAATRARNQRDRLGKRAKAGVCPCCNRTFKQLARHMAGQHPEYDPTKED